MMSYHTWVNPRHVFMTPSKHILAPLEELDEVLLRLLLYACSYPREFLWAGFIQLDVLQYFNRFDDRLLFLNTHYWQLFIYC